MILTQKDEISCDAVIQIAESAGQKILEVYHHPKVYSKDGGSPVTNADLMSHQLICDALSTLTPDIPIVSEEGVFEKYPSQMKLFWLVDPLDGTKEFINRNDEFTVNIALIRNGAPVLGVVHIPALMTTYYASDLSGAFKRTSTGFETRLDCSLNAKDSKTQITVIGSRSHGSDRFQEFIDQLKTTYNDVHVKVAGSSLKFCLVAEGGADIYPRFGPTMEWDTAAAHAVLKYSHGTVWSLESKDVLTYGKSDLRNPAFIAGWESLLCKII